LAVAIESSGAELLRLAPRKVKGLRDAIAAKHKYKPRPPTMRGESPCAIKHSVITGLDCPRAALKGEVLGCQC